MKKSWLLFAVLFMLCLASYGQDSTLKQTPNDSVSRIQDSLENNTPLTFADSLASPVLMRKYFFLNEQISGTAVILKTQEQARDLPRLKAIKIRKLEASHWKFWILLLTVFFLALIRLLNVKRFDEIILSSFDIHADFKGYSDKTGNYLVSNIGLFINFILSLSLFLTTFLELNHQIETDNYYLLFWKFSLVLFLVYLAKIIINMVVGLLFKMRKLSVVILFNAIMVNNILGVGLVFLNLFFVFVTDLFSAKIISAIILITILVAVIYRQIKNLLMSPQSGRFQFLYIFLYLCALELLPWLILFKLFLNSW
ncbi:MAG: hypothetical protein CFE21_07825 [Bacteroidetes bacterium B1(2017)]|nr:MAG: hypothetical protein CFE21_07825 [Bacteroidetes bacterium B1(2017)]